MTIPFGARVRVTQTLARVHNSRKAFWLSSEIKPRMGLCIGYRTIFNGDRWWEDEEVGYVFNPTEHFRVMLVVFDAHTNPVYVPLNTVEEIQI